MTSKYKDIGKKQIIGVIEKLIQKVEAIEITVNLFIQHIDKDKKFDEFVKEKLGGDNELQSDETTDGKGNNSDNNENA